SGAFAPVVGISLSGVHLSAVGGKGIEAPWAPYPRCAQGTRRTRSGCDKFQHRGYHRQLGQSGPGLLYQARTTVRTARDRPMRTIDISIRLLSEAVWKRILEASAYRLVEKKEKFFETMASLEALRQQAEYDTGSISTASAWILYSLSFYFRPQR